MRNAVVCLLSGAVVLAGCSPKSNAPAASSTASAAAQAIATTGPAPPAGSTATPFGAPKPRTGVWETVMNLPAGPRGGMKMTSRVCLDESSLKNDGWMNGAQAKHMPDCTRAFSGAPGGYSFSSVCKIDGRTMSTKGLATGDFQSAYRLELTSRMDPPPPGPMAGEQHMVIEARWIGPCAPGQAAGLVTNSVKMTPAG